MTQSPFFQKVEQIFFGTTLKDKLLDPGVPDFQWDNWKEVPSEPGREDHLAFSQKKVRFPKPGSFYLSEKKAMGLHAFANHELLAIEMMAAALLYYPHDTDELKRFKRGVLASLRDEQKHLHLYVQRLNELGYNLGDFPLNGFFWKQMETLKTPAQYLAVMALTFEAANLDFASYYQNLFLEMGDEATAKIMETVLIDEISHVKLGEHYLGKWRGDKNFWDYYQELLPFPLTPARAKGIHFFVEPRLKAGLSESFIEAVDQFEDGYRVTNRRQWKQE